MNGTTGDNRCKYFLNFRKYHDQQIDMTDCLSFAIMEGLELNNAMTFDNDFRIHGFKLEI